MAYFFADDSDGSDLVHSDGSDLVHSVPAVYQCQWGRVRQLNVDFDRYETEEELLLPDDLHSPLDFYKLIVTHEVIALIVEETNRYARQRIQKFHEKGERPKFNWIPTSRLEIQIYLGIVILMGMNRQPSTRHYWSVKRKDIFGMTLIKKAMTRDRFDLLTSFLHFSNNNAALIDDPKDIKIKDLIYSLDTNAKQFVIPAQGLVVDDTLFAWRGRLSFR